MTEKKYEIRVTRLSVGPSSEPLFSEQSTDVEITDEAGGEFVTVRQKSDHVDAQGIQIDPEEWPELQTAIQQMIDACRNGA